ncbi:MAG: tetratricopeptide repeat protein [Carboxylicivirga sp.]|nr:tetratricopeptide repeat protein [Carboxylicivirga sp.]
MRKLILFLFVSFVLFGVTQLIAQEQPDSLIVGNDIINEAIKLHDDGKYESAILKYKDVSDCDPSYPFACYEMALTYNTMGRDSLALAKCYEALDLDYDVSAVYVLIGSIYDEQGNHKASLQMLEEAASKWPYNQNVLYNLGVTQISAGLYREAEQTLQQSVLIDPYHGSSHKALGDVNYRMGRAAQSYLAYSFGLMLSPTISNIQALQNILTGKQDMNYKPYFYPYPADYDHAHWDRLKHLVQSELAFHDDFPFDYEVNYAIVRQTYMLLSETKFKLSDESFYNQLYARYFQELMQEVGFTTYLNYMLKNTNDAKVKKWRESNEEKIDQFIKWAQNKIVTGRQYGFQYKQQQEGTKLYHYDEGELWGIGALVSNSEATREGAWTFVNGYGQITEKCNYLNGKKQGEGFIYWEKDKVKQHLFYEAGEFNGDCITYHQNGKVSGEYPMKNGKRHGIQSVFTPSGELTERIHYSENEFNGPYMYLNTKTGFRQELSYKDGEIEGNFNESWLNGKHKMLSHYKAGKAEGEYQTFYKNGALESYSIFKNDVKIDTFKEYYINGKLQHLACLNDSGKLVGTNLFYNRHGQLIASENNYQDGVLYGSRLEFRGDGTKQHEYIYQNDSLMALKCYSPDEQVIYQAELKDQKIDYKSYYEDGVLFEEGILKDGQREGLWKKYNPFGGMMEVQEYMSGMVHGKVQSYYSNGQLRMTYACDSNIIEGPFIHYHKSGAKSRTGWFTKGKWQGVWRNYFDNGVLKDESFYEDNEVRGKSKLYSPLAQLVLESYYNDNGQLERITFYNEEGKQSADVKLEDGLAHIEEFFSNGQIKRDWHYRDHDKEGKQLVYYPNGQLLSEETYLCGFEEGLSRGWAHDGKKRYEFQFAMGQPDGMAKFYKNNEVSTEKEYELGVLQSKKINYFPGGVVSSKVEYEDDESHGYSSYYNPQGQLIYRERYAFGYLKGISYEQEAGYSEEVVLAPGKKKINCSYKNKKKSASFTIVDGNYDGRVLWYYPSGKLYRDCNYVKGIQQGSAKWYYANGKLKEEINYVDDAQEGTYRQYHENGQLKVDGTYVCGVRDGTWKYFSSNGKHLRTLYYHNDEIYEIEE